MAQSRRRRFVQPPGKGGRPIVALRNRSTDGTSTKAISDRRLYRKKSLKFIVLVLKSYERACIFCGIIEPEPAPPISPAAAAKSSTTTRAPRRTRPDHLTHIRIPHDVPECEKTCSCCGGPKTLIGEDESRELDYFPARLEVKVHVLPKYACPKCRDGVASPPVPPKPIPGGIAGAVLVSFVVVSKFADRGKPGKRDIHR
jgi:zinc-finger binding domain of transposase IS66